MNRTLLAFTTAVLFGCSSGSKSMNDGGLQLSYDDMAQLSYHYVVNAIALPMSYSDYAVDLDSDGATENQFGNIVKTLLSQMIDAQASENSSITKGEGLTLFSFKNGDPSFGSDSGASAVSYLAQNVATPDFTGKGMFIIDTTVPSGTLSGPLSGGNFLSTDPYTLAMPPTVWVRIGLAPGVAVNMPCMGSRVRFTPRSSGLQMGQLNGGFRKTDIDAILVPGIRQSLDNIAHTMPCDTNCMNVLNTFDTNNDGMIELSEVQNNILVINILKPDVQLFDASGKWKPTSPATAKDSISFGVGFTAVPAVFSE
jgi:hypothetical protein